MGYQRSEVGVPHLPVELTASDNWDLFSFVEADPAGEERDDISAAKGRETEAEIVDVGALEEESPLLWEEEGEASEIGATRVDFRFSKVGVDRANQRNAGSEPLGHVQTGFQFAFRIKLGSGLFESADESRPDDEAEAGIETRKLRDQPCPARLRDLRVADRARPAAYFLDALRAPFNVEAPFPQRTIEREALERDANLGRPAVVSSCRRRLPYGVPTRIFALAPACH